MKMKSLSKKAVKIIGISTFLTVITLLLNIIPIIKEGKISPYKNSNGDDINKEWNYKWELSKGSGTIALPSVLKGEVKNDTVTITKTLPNVQLEEPTLFIRTSQQYLKVCVEGQLIYTYGDKAREGKRIFPPGSAFHFIKLPPNYMGKKVDISLSSPFKQYLGNVDRVALGNRGDHLSNIFYEYNLIFIASVILIILGIILLGLYLPLRLIRKEVYGVLHLGKFSMLTGIWILSESKIIQLYYFNPPVIFYISTIAVFLIPIPFLLFIRVTYKLNNKTLLLHLAYIHGAFFIIATMLEISGILTYVSLTITFHMLLVISLVITISIVIREFILGNKDLKELAIGYGALGTFIILDIYRYYFSAIPRLDSQKFSIVGLSIFFILIYFKMEQIIGEFYENKVKNQMLEFYAYHDILTGLKNRNYFENIIKKLNGELKYRYEMNVILFDFNNLKKINDTYGHSEGDKLIINGAHIIKECFMKTGEVFRTGGDEFILIANCNRFKVEGVLNALETKIQEFNINNTPNISIAYGVASYEKDKDKNINDIIMRADNLMYMHKRKVKMNG